MKIVSWPPRYIKQLTGLLAVLLAVIALSGCALMGMDTKGGYSWGKLNEGGRYAIISVYASPDIGYGAKVSPGANVIVSNSADRYDSQKILNQVTPSIVQAFRNIEEISVMSSRSVKRSAAYKATAASEPEGPVNIASGYKLMRAQDNDARYGELAKALKVDGVLMINISFGYSDDKMIDQRSTGGSSTVKAKYGDVMIWVNGYGTNGKKILWTGKVGQSEAGDDLSDKLKNAVDDAMAKQQDLIVRKLARVDQ